MRIEGIHERSKDVVIEEESFERDSFILKPEGIRNVRFVPFLLRGSSTIVTRTE